MGDDKVMEQPPGIINDWDLTKLNPTKIKNGMENLISKLYSQVDLIAKSEISVDNILMPILDYNHWFYNTATLYWFPASVVIDKEIREASREAKKRMEEALINVSMRVDIFDKLEKLKDNLGPDIHPEYERALNKMIRDGRRNGLHLDEERKDNVSELRTKITNLKIQFEKNVSEDKTLLFFTEEEMEGVPSRSLSNYDKEDGRYKVTMKYPHILPISKFCKIEETRRRVHEAKASVAKEENTKVLEELIRTRDQLAKVLGYKNHAEFVLDDLMAKSPQQVDTFLSDLANKLTPLWNKEREEMEKLKKEECQEYGWTYTPLQLWDTSYYSQKVEEKLHKVDKEGYKPYFPLDHVTKQMFGIYEQLLQVKIDKVHEAPKWHEDVDMYSVQDSRDGSPLGYFYLDLFPREGKYTHFCCEQIQYSCEDENGLRVPSVVAMLCNFSLPLQTQTQSDKKISISLLDHEEVETYFHEFGHLMHSICAKTKTAYFSGAPLESCSGVERDFIEAPSQMLENWVWSKIPLKRMSKHVETGDPLPDKMIDKLIKTRHVNAGLFNLRQIVYALFDQRIHQVDICNTAKVFGEMMKQLVGLEVLPSTNFAASFNHLAKQYDAKYYSYLWSEVFSADMFATGFGEENIMNEDLGMKYRTLILQPSGTVDAFEMLKNFLGREPKPDAFLRMKGL